MIHFSSWIAHRGEEARSSGVIWIMNMSMVDPLWGAFLIDIGVPVLAVLLSVYAKCVSRNDQQKSISPEDFAVGLDLAIAALLIFIVSCGVEAERVARQVTTAESAGCSSDAPWIVFAMVLAIWALSTWIRKWGWHANGQLRTGCGVVGPIVVGVAMLLFAVTWQHRCDQ
jgi:multisubunit Na+/H+ antiporter MnhC subunit